MVKLVVIEHADGRRYAVTPEAHQRLYPDFTVVHDVSDTDYVPVGIPKPKRSRPRPRAKT